MRLNLVEVFEWGVHKFKKEIFNLFQKIILKMKFTQIN